MNVDWNIYCCPYAKHSSYHTYDLSKHGSLDLELNLPLVPDQAMQFINHIVIDMLEHGKRYQSGDRVDEVFNLPFYLFETTPVLTDMVSNRVLRILFCDPDNKYPWEEGCQPPYSDQLNASESAAMRVLLEQKRGMLS